MALNVLEAAQRLVKAATGEEFGDGMMVTDLGVGYASHKWGRDETTVWVAGDWNDGSSVWDRERNGETVPLRDKVPSRLAAALERIGAEVEWHDCVSQCQDCWRLIDTEPSSYSWVPEYAWVDDHGYVCHECLLKDMDTSIEDYIDNSDKALTWCETSDIEKLGFTLWTGIPEGSESGRFESGWHPGQDASPSKIMDEIHEHDSDLQVVFFLDENSQFYVGFSAWTRPTPDED